MHNVAYTATFWWNYALCGLVYLLQSSLISIFFFAIKHYKFASHLFDSSIEKQLFLQHIDSYICNLSIIVVPVCGVMDPSEPISDDEILRRQQSSYKFHQDIVL